MFDLVAIDPAVVSVPAAHSTLLLRASTGRLGLKTDVASGSLVLDVATNGDPASFSALTINAGSAAAPTLNFVGSTTTGLFSPATNMLAVATNGVERLRVAAGGNFLLGTTTDDGVTKLQVSGASSFSLSAPGRITSLSSVQAVNDAGSYISFFGGSGATVRGFLGYGKTGTGADTLFVGEDADSFSVKAQNSLHFGNSSALAMTIKSTGNVLIATNTDDGVNKLQISGGVSFFNGPFASVANNGPAATGTGTVNNLGGNGGSSTITAGNGGAATGATSGSNTGGNGGSLTFTAGNGGAATTGTGPLNGGVGGTFIINAGVGGAGTIAGSGGPIIFQTATTTALAERMRISPAGNLLIGTTTDDAVHKLQVVGAVGFKAGMDVTGGDFSFADAGTSDSTAVRVFSVGGNLYLQNGSGGFINFRSKTAAVNVSISDAGLLYVASNLIGVSGGYLTSGLPGGPGYLGVAGGGATSANAAQIYWGDNTGWKLNFGTRSAGTFIPRVSFVDAGRVLIGTTTDDGVNLLQVNGGASILGNVTLADAKNIVLGTATGTQIGTAITQKIGFYGAAPTAQRAGAAQVAVATTASTNATPYGFTTAAQADSIVTLVNELRAAAVALGLIKGAA